LESFKSFLFLIDSFEFYRGKALDTTDLCRLHGIWQRSFGDAIREPPKAEALGLYGLTSKEGGLS
jgi:hypothetical protein